MLRILNKTDVPPGGWSYTEKNTGYEMTSLTLLGLFEQVEAHRKANGISYGAGWKLILEMEICAQDKMRRHCGEPAPAGPMDSERQFQMRDLGVFFRTIRRWVSKNRLAIVSKELVKSRAEVCRKCPKNMDIVGCSGCNGITRWAEEFLPEDRRQIPGLKSCGVCGCYLPLKIQLPLEANLETSVPGDEFPDHCWMVTEALPHHDNRHPQHL